MRPVICTMKMLLVSFKEIEQNMCCINKKKLTKLTMTSSEKRPNQKKRKLKKTEVSTSDSESPYSDVVPNSCCNFENDASIVYPALNPIKRHVIVNPKESDESTEEELDLSEIQ